MEQEQKAAINYYAGYAAGVRALTDWLEHNAAGLKVSRNTTLKSIIHLCSCIALRPDKLMQDGTELEVFQDDTGKARRFYMKD